MATETSETSDRHDYTQYVHEFERDGKPFYAVAQWNEAAGQFHRPFDEREQRITGCSGEFGRFPHQVQHYADRTQALRRARYLFGPESDEEPAPVVRPASLKPAVQPRQVAVLVSLHQGYGQPTMDDPVWAVVHVSADGTATRVPGALTDFYHADNVASAEGRRTHVSLTVSERRAAARVSGVKSVQMSGYRIE